MSAAVDVAAPSRTPVIPGDALLRMVPDFALLPIQGGLGQVITRVTTRQPVVFLTIDDGVTKSPKSVELPYRYCDPVPMFLAKSLVQADPDYCRQLMRGDDFAVAMSTRTRTRVTA